ncbi:transposase, partial [Ruminococcus sp. MCC718]|uniref:zinc ribbon domain-containing protein n=1 Tax=Ruminococcus sp. MCC718 TaxID=2592649 RepID=UPI001C0118E8
IKLQAKCNENGMELRVANRWYPSSKTCHCCKNIRKDLKLSDRIFKCACGYIEERDFNAAYRRLFREFTTVECTRTCE